MKYRTLVRMNSTGVLMETRIRTLRRNLLAKLSISVLIDTYNQERFIKKAINSVLEQDFPVAEREIIVVDDGSSDHTPQIVQRFEPNLRYIRKENGGQASAFNVGIPECQGQIIAFLDGDDYWLPGKLSRVADVLAKNAAVGFVGHAVKESLPDGQERMTIPGDADSLTLAISSLCGNSQLRHKLGCAAQEKMKRFTWKLSALRHEAVFRRAKGVRPVPTVPGSQETTTGGASYSGKVVLN